MEEEYYNDEQNEIYSQDIFGIAAAKLIDEMLDLQAIEDRENSIDDGSDEPDENNTTVDSYDVGFEALLKTIDAVNVESGDAICLYDWLHILNDVQNKIVNILHTTSSHHRLSNVDISID